MMTEKVNRTMHNLLGAEVEVMDEVSLRELKTPFGVRVTKVFADPASSTGLRPGDVIVTIDFKPVKNVKVLDELLKSLPKNRSVAVRVLRDGRSLFLPLAIEK
jgi:serine protease Do